ncbi:MAG TPA: riboflavin synthase [Planctomycetota bacterium]|jgi:riboflavin synthase|nr:riboflavin synthase [Planctomycetota bacterium]
MFTGIVERRGRILRPGRRLAVETGWSDLAHGESVAVSGVCLTVARLKGSAVEFDLVAETLKKTNLGALQKGDSVNLERALRHGDRLSGHLVQGHVEGTGTVVQSGKTLRVETELAAQMIPKGSITVDGVSLTIVDVEPGAFTVALIPVTRRITTLGRVKKGARVNLELDVMTKRPGKPSRITREFLRRAGF